jgi:hypothetical protein
MIKLTRLSWAILGFLFWCWGMVYDNVGAFFTFGLCFGQTFFNEKKQ